MRESRWIGWRVTAFIALLASAVLSQACSDASVPAASDGEAVPAGAQAKEAPDKKPAPDFSLERLGGGAASLADFRGRIVIMDFWATWCPPCEFQVPELNAFYDAHKDDGDVAVLGVSVDTDGPDGVGAWVDEKGVRYPILLGGEPLARKIGAIGFPTLIVVTPDGLIDSQHVGLIERDALEAALSRIRAPKS